MKPMYAWFSKNDLSALWLASPGPHALASKKLSPCVWPKRKKLRRAFFKKNEWMTHGLLKFFLRKRNIHLGRRSVVY